MKRLLLLSALLLSLIPFGHAATKTDTIRLVFRHTMSIHPENGKIGCAFSSDMENAVTVKWFDDGSEYRQEIRPTEEGVYIREIDHAGQFCICYSYDPTAEEEGYGVEFRHTDFEREDYYREIEELKDRHHTIRILFDPFVAGLSLDVSGCTSLNSLSCGAVTGLESLDVSGCTSLAELYCSENGFPLSTLYDIYTQRESWDEFVAFSQQDFITLSGCQALDLSKEKMLGGTATTYTLKNAVNQSVSSDAYTQNDFVFQFNHPATYILTLQNESVPNASMTYRITAEECKTDTLYFEFALEEGTASATIEYRFTEAVLSGIQMEYNDGEEHAKFTPDASGSITVTGNGHGRIYYTYGESGGYSARCSSLLSVLNNEDIRVGTLSGVQLTSLDVHACTALKELSCYNNQLATLNVSGCTALTELNCSGNPLTSLDVSTNTALTELRCVNNQLTSLDVSHNSALTWLWCSENQLAALDVSGCTDLDWLSCDNNRLTGLEVSGCAALEVLDCSYNQLTALDVIANTALETLHCQDNQLTDLDVSADTALTSLWCNGNQLTTLDVSKNPNLNNLFCYDNHIPLSTLYGIYAQRESWVYFFANPQTDTVALAGCEAWDLSSEKTLGDNETTFAWEDEDGDAVSDGAYTEDNFIFQFNDPFTGTLTLQNASVPNVSMTYFVSAEKCLVETFRVDVVVNNADWGSVAQSGDGTYKKDSWVTITATPAEGYRFVNWMRAGLPAAISTEAVYTFAVTENLILVAIFEEIPEEPVEEDFTVILTPNNPAWGKVLKTGNCTYGEGEEITILALPFAGCRFVNWTKADGSVFATDSLYTFKVSESLELTANFERIPDEPIVVETFTVNVSANNEAWGSVSQSGEGTYEKDSSATITATPAEGYHFVNWTKEGDVFGTASDTTFAVTEDLTLVANFEEVKDEKPTEDDIHIYVKDNTIYLPADKGKVEIFNVIGQCMYSGHATAVRVRQTGVYIVCIAGQNHKVLVM